MRDQHLAGCLEPTRKQREEVINNSNTCDAMEQRPSSHTYPASSSAHPLSSNPFPIFPPHTHEITSRCKHLFCPKCNNNTDTTKIAIKDELGERKAKEKKGRETHGEFRINQLHCQLLWRALPDCFSFHCTGNGVDSLVSFVDFLVQGG